MIRSRIFVVLIAFLISGISAPPAPVHAQTSGKLKLAYLAPDDGLAFVTWNGWQPTDAKSANRVERVLAEPSVKEFGDQLFVDLQKTFDRFAARRGGPEETLVAKHLPGLIKLLLSHPGAMYLARLNPTNVSELEFAFVIDAEHDGPKAIETIRTLLDAIPKDGPQGAITETIDDATFYRPREYSGREPEVRIGFRASQLIAVFGREAPKKLIAKLKTPGAPPAAIAKVLNDLPVERPSMLLHVNGAGFLTSLQPILAAPFFAPAINALGVSQLESLSIVSGLDSAAGVTKGKLTTVGAPQGIFAVIPDKPLTIDSLKRIPASAAHAAVSRFDLAYLLEQCLVMADKAQPGARAQMEAALAQFAAQAGFSVKDDWLAALGDEWTIYASGIDPGAFGIPGIVITTNVRDHARLSKSLDIIVGQLKAVVQQFGPQSPITVTDFSTRGEKGQRLTINNVPIPLAPTWVLTKDQFIIGLTPQLVTTHLTSGTLGKSLAESAEVRAAFQRTPKPIAITYSDPKPGLRTVYTLINSFSPMLLQEMARGGLEVSLPALPPLIDLEDHLAPSVTTVTRTPNGWQWEGHYVLSTGSLGGAAPILLVGTSWMGLRVHAARAVVAPAAVTVRPVQPADGRNNLKHIGLAMHNFLDGHKVFPPAAITDKNGKALLSWRVHILPFVDQIALYKQFHLDEPWDSEHNKTLIENIPPVFIAPHHKDLAKDGKTVYLVPTGKGLAFEGNAALSIQDFRDGTSNTILAVEAHKDAAVVWTKPSDLDVDLKQPLKNLKSAMPGGFRVLTTDGRVVQLKDDIDPDLMAALFTRNGRERISGILSDTSVPKVGAVASSLAVPAPGVVTKTGRMLNGHQGVIWTVAFSPDDKTLASAGDDTTIRIWDLSANKIERELAGHTALVRSVKWASDGKSLFSGSFDKTIRQWNLESGQVTSTLNSDAGVFYISLSKDESLLASGSADNLPRVWNLKAQREILRPEGHTGVAWAAAISPDGKLLASGARDKQVRLWDVATGRLTATLEGHTDSVGTVMFSPDGKQLATTGAGDRTVRLWDVATGQSLLTIAEHGGLVYDVAFAPDGKSIATSCEDNKVRVFELENGRGTNTFDGGANCVTFSRDGKQLASGGRGRVFLERLKPE